MSPNFRAKKGHYLVAGTRTIEINKMKKLKPLLIFCLLGSCCIPQTTSVKSNSKRIYVRGASKRGDRTKENITETVVKNSNILRQYYFDRGKINPELRGKITIHFHVVSTGKVLSAEIAANTTQDTVFANLIVNKVKEFDFGEISNRNDTTEIYYPFVFSR